MKKVLFVFGTRPEAIKMAPPYLKFSNKKEFITKLCVTAQHREMLDSVLEFFKIQPDFDLDLMKPNQNLFSLTSEIILGLKSTFENFKPDLILTTYFY